MITTAIEINPNLRSKDGETSVDLHDLDGLGPIPSVGQEVAVYERTTRLYGRGVVRSIDQDDVLLSVEWDDLHFFAADGGLGFELTPDLVLGLVNNRLNLPLTMGDSPSYRIVTPSPAYVPQTATVRLTHPGDVYEAIA